MNPNIVPKVNLFSIARSLGYRIAPIESLISRALRSTVLQLPHGIGPIFQHPGVNQKSVAFKLVSDLPIVSIVVPFLRSPFGILNIDLVKPKQETTMETIGRIWGAVVPRI